MATRLVRGKAAAKKGGKRQEGCAWRWWSCRFAARCNGIPRPCFGLLNSARRIIRIPVHFAWVFFYQYQKMML